MKNKIILISIFVIILILVFKNSFSILLKDNLSQKNKDFIVNNFLIFKKIERLEREISNKNKQIEINQTIIEDQKVKIKALHNNVDIITLINMFPKKNDFEADAKQVINEARKTGIISDLQKK